MSPADHKSPTLDELRHQIAAHRAARHARLIAEDGWLTVVGKTWVGAGVHTVGAAPGSAIELPAHAPMHAGSITVEGAKVTFAPDAKVVATVAGDRFLGPLEVPNEGVRIGSITLQLVRRDGDVAVRVRDRDAPARRSFQGVPAYPVDPSWRLWAALRPHATVARIVLEDGDGRPQEYLSPGAVTFEHSGRTIELEPVYDSDRTRLFLLFADPTNRDETYGAGRFLYAPLPQDGRVLLDFNEAFSPPCAFTPYATCPLPPPNNRTSVRIEAGEKSPNVY